MRWRIDERRAWVLVSCGFLTFLAVIPAATSHVRGNYDSFLYIAPPTLSSGRLPLVPLVYMLLGEGGAAVAVFQALFGGICWSLLLWELSYVRSRPARLGLITAVTWMGCSTYVVTWDAALLSESLSISLLVMAAAWLARWQRTGSGLWAATITASAWAWSRSTNAYMVLLIGIITAVYAAVRTRRQVIKALVLLAMGLFATVVSGEGTLWQQPFLHSMSQRFLPDPALTAWFAGHGMPLTDRLRSLAGPYTTAVDHAFYHDPALTSFRAWMTHSGKRDFILFLITHPWWCLHGAFSGHEELGSRVITLYGGGVSRPWLPAVVRDLLLPYRQDTLVAIGALDVAASAYVAARQRWTNRATIWMGVAGLGLLSLVIDWAGDPWEVGRHSIEGTIGTALAGLMLLASLQITPERTASESPPGPVPKHQQLPDHDQLSSPVIPSE